MQKVILYSDGSARANPDGPGGYGTILQYVDSKGQLQEKELSRGYPKTTNNRMELMGVIAGLECLRRPCQVEVYSDSQYVVNAFNKNWIGAWQKNGWKTASRQPVKNKELWDRLLAAMQPHTVHYHWVKGHAENEFNNRCDAMAVAEREKFA
jgi:ribonuclease HI